MNQISQAIKVLKAGGVVVYPTDTSYGLAVDATNPSAVRKLYKLKGRDFKKPVHIIPPSKSSIRLFARISEYEKKLINRFMPGPITLVLPLKAKGKSWEMLSAGTKTLGVRLPNHKTALRLVQRFGKPITTTSANQSGNAPAYSIQEAKKQFSKSIYLGIYFLDGGRLKRKKPSTIVRIDKKHVKILREGPVKKKQIEKALKTK